LLFIDEQNYTERVLENWQNIDKLI